MVACDPDAGASFIACIGVMPLSADCGNWWLYKAPHGPPVRFTVSIGVTTLINGLPVGLTSLDTLLDLADQAFNQTKNRGRNQVCCFLRTA